VQENDVDELYTLLNGLTDTAKRFFHPHPFDKQTIRTICSSENDHYFVMLLDKRIIGYSMLRLFGYEIPSFGCCIRTGYEGQGYGTRFTIWALSKAKELGYKKIILKTYKDNIRALKLYQKTGFKITGENPDTNEFKMAITF
jgi:RimJ/RimL family protein N-acetyltransferase